MCLCGISLTIVRLGKAGRRLEETLQEGGVDLLHCQVLDAVCVPIHIVADSLKKEKQQHLFENSPRTCMPHASSSLRYKAVAVLKAKRAVKTSCDCVQQDCTAMGSAAASVPPWGTLISCNKLT